MMPPEIAIRALVQDDATCAELIKAGIKRAAEFADTGRMAGEYLDLFNFALAGDKRL
jgi:hypothetical protein